MSNEGQLLPSQIACILLFTSSPQGCGVYASLRASQRREAYLDFGTGRFLRNVRHFTNDGSFPTSRPTPHDSHLMVFQPHRQIDQHAIAQPQIPHQTVRMAQYLHHGVQNQCIRAITSSRPHAFRSQATSETRRASDPLDEAFHEVATWECRACADD